MSELIAGENGARVLLEEIAANGGLGGIESQEARGQKKLIESDLLPTEIMWSTEQDFINLGFVFDEPLEDDPLFRPTTLPEGWEIRPAEDHSMWSYIYDEAGMQRVGVFYKAAFYDRKAHMGLVNA